MNVFIKKAVSAVIAAAFAVCTPLYDSYASIESFESVEKSADPTVVDTAFESTSSVISENDIPECLAPEALENSKFAARLYEKETSLDTVLFANKDGSETVYIFNEDVKYVNESGKIADKSNKLYSNVESKAYSSDYSYVNKENDINTYFPKLLKTDVGVSVEAQDQAIEMYPMSDVVSKVTADDDMYGVYYDGVFGEFTGIRYEPSFSGYKEDIVLEKNVGNKFGFILETGDLVPVLENGVIYIRDEKGGDFGIISPIYVYDSFDGDPSLEKECHFTYDNSFVLTRISDGKYELIVVVDEDFLNNPATVYPVIVDPSITINVTGSGSSKSILDTPVYNGSGVAGTAGVNSLAVIGYVGSSYGSGRLLMRFPGLMRQSFMKSDCTISSATLTVKECSGGSSGAAVIACNYTGPAWDETTKYSSSVYNGVGYSIDYWFFSYPDNVTKSYNITSAVKAWQTNPSQGEKGIIFQNATSETDSSKTKNFYTSEGTTKPYLSVTYSYNGIARNQFYSKYEPNKFNHKGETPPYGTKTDLIQYRMNCYGYAFCNILNGYATMYGKSGYKQQPGDFASAADKRDNKVKPFVRNNPSLLMDNMVSNIKLDARRLGYSIKEYNPPSSTVKQFGSQSRLIALVTGDTDYHFYMQHSDGTWSHKPGSLPVTNLSLQDYKNEPQYKLTNANIRSYANKGAYKNGELKFFEITKSAVIDHPHGVSTGNTETVLYYKGKAGENVYTSATKYIGSTYARIDFAEDNDVYCFTAPSAKKYTIQTTCSSGDDLDCVVLNDTGSIVTTQTGIGQVNFTLSMSAGQTYFLIIYNKNKNVTDYVLNVS